MRGHRGSGWAVLQAWSCEGSGRGRPALPHPTSPSQGLRTLRKPPQSGSSGAVGPARRGSRTPSAAQAPCPAGTSSSEAAQGRVPGWEVQLGPGSPGWQQERLLPAPGLPGWGTSRPLEDRRPPGDPYTVWGQFVNPGGRHRGTGLQNGHRHQVTGPGLASGPRHTAGHGPRAPARRGLPGAPSRTSATPSATRSLPGLWFHHWSACTSQVSRQAEGVWAWPCVTVV